MSYEMIALMLPLSRASMMLLFLGQSQSQSQGRRAIDEL